MKRNWKRYVPGSTLEAIRACKDYAIERHGLSVERIADRLGVSADLDTHEHPELDLELQHG